MSCCSASGNTGYNRTPPPRVTLYEAGVQKRFPSPCLRLRTRGCRAPRSGALSAAAQACRPGALDDPYRGVIEHQRNVPVGGAMGGGFRGAGSAALRVPAQTPIAKLTAQGTSIVSQRSRCLSALVAATAAESPESDMYTSTGAARLVTGSGRKGPAARRVLPPQSTLLAHRPRTHHCPRR